MRYALLLVAVALAAVGALVLSSRESTAARPIAAPELPAIRGQAFGTSYAVKIADTLPGDASVLANRISTTLQEIDRQLSTYRDDSELSRFNQQTSTDWFAVSPAVVELIDAARQISRATGGAFDVTVAPLSRVWGFGKTRRDRPPTEAEVTTALGRVGFEKLETRASPPALRKLLPEIEVDVSALGEGYALGRIAELLRAQGAANFFIEFGGEILVSGKNRDGQPWRAGIERPIIGERAIHCAVELRDTALSTSGSYRNFREVNGRRFCHIIDPRLGRPIGHALVSASVVDSSPLCADAFATVLMVLGPKDGLALAETMNLAVLLIEDVNGELRERATPQFERLRVK